MNSYDHRYYTFTSQRIERKPGNELHLAQLQVRRIRDEGSLNLLAPILHRDKLFLQSLKRHQSLEPFDSTSHANLDNVLPVRTCGTLEYLNDPVALFGELRTSSENGFGTARGTHHCLDLLELVLETGDAVQVKPVGWIVFLQNR